MHRTWVLVDNPASQAGGTNGRVSFTKRGIVVSTTIATLSRSRRAYLWKGEKNRVDVMERYLLQSIPLDISDFYCTHWRAEGRVQRQCRVYRVCLKANHLGSSAGRPTGTKTHAHVTLA